MKNYVRLLAYGSISLTNLVTCGYLEHTGVESFPFLGLSRFINFRVQYHYSSYNIVTVDHHHTMRVTVDHQLNLEKQVVSVTIGALYL
jgi:hypothetical protein